MGWSLRKSLLEKTSAKEVASLAAAARWNFFSFGTTSSYTIIATTRSGHGDEIYLILKDLSPGWLSFEGKSHRRVEATS